MKIGILTHPQGINYGGILQCYALCVFLRRLGHEPIVIQRVSPKSFFLIEWARSILKALHHPRYYNPEAELKSINITPFVVQNLERTYKISSNCSIKRAVKKYGFEAILVGSDQVWRKSFALNFGYNYFLDFAPDRVIKFSYAASFGLEDWQYDQKQSQMIKNYLSNFKGISVREKSAIDMIYQNIGIEAVQHLDPTMLLVSQEYESIASPRLYKEKYVFVYWLGDRSTIIKEIDEYKIKGYRIVETYLRDKVVLPSIENWLSLIKYADVVLTDSFHGAVFSIIFHRQLKLFPNISGGLGRVASLFDMLEIKPEEPYDFLRIDDKLLYYRLEALKYLNFILSSD